MEKEFLEKIRKLNWVLSESTTGTLSYEDLSRILSSLIESNVYIVNREGQVLGASYIDESDTSTVENERGFLSVPEEDNLKFLDIAETKENLIGEDLVPVLGENYPLKDKFHMIVPSSCGGQRLGTLILARYGHGFNDEDVALCEYGATVVGLEIQRNLQLERAKERTLRMAVDMAFETLSYSERDALDKILGALDEDKEGIIVASKVAQQHGLTNSIIVNALKKMESAGLLETKSLGMKGTYIKIVNPYLE